ncbi:MAG: hypothetical protein OIF50_07325 [Flavobacteriaceae bacterium]|nr:hypothetical protein [Flavobacteriaceae bacterium]
MFPSNKSDKYPLEIFEEYDLKKEGLSLTFKKGTDISESIDTQQHITFITKGIVLVYRLQESGNISIIDIKSSGQILQPTIDISLEDKESTHFKAYSQTEICAFNRKQLFFNQKPACKKDKVVSNFLIRIIENDIKSIYRQLEFIKESSLEKRYQMFLERYGNIYNDISDRLIASFLGVHFTTLSRMKTRYFNLSQQTG